MIATHETPTADYPPEIPLSRIVEVAKLAKISDAHLPIFSEDLLLLLAKVSCDYKTREQRLALEQKIEREIASVGKAAGKLAQALTALSGGGRFGLLRRLHGGPLVLQGDEDILQGMKALDSLTQQIERLRAAAQPPGRDAKGSNSDPLDAFVGDLMQMIVCSGGNASFNKNDGTGAFSRVLQVLAPHLPDGLLPPWVVEPDNFETPHGARAIFDATRCAKRSAQSLSAILRDANAICPRSWRKHAKHGALERVIEKLSSPSFFVPSNAVLLSGRFCHFRRVGRAASEIPFQYVAPREDGSWLSRNWTKTAWKKHRFLS